MLSGLRRRSLKGEFYVKSNDSLPPTLLFEIYEAVLSKKLSLRFQIKGFSMSPFIKDKDIITISPVSDYIDSLGKTVVFIHPQTNNLFMHRIICRGRDYYLIKGDNIFSSDGLIPRENILGVVTKIERKGKKISFGLGYERYLIAILSKTKILNLSLRIIRLILAPIKKIIP